MKQKSYDEQLNSVCAIRDFWQNNELKPRNNQISFKANVIYSSKLHSLSGIAEIRISLKGYKTDGQIVINGDLFDVNVVHIDFLPQFQDYTYDKSNKSLAISGDSPKMGGNYKVIITLSS